VDTVAGPRPRPSANTSETIRRQRIVLIIASATALVWGASVIATMFGETPSRSAADRRSPSAGVLTAPVMSQVLTRTVVVRGTVVTARTVAVTPAGAPGAPRLVVTRLGRRPGDQIRSGDVVIEVSGRPLIALPGAMPAHRDLRPGDTGEDVAQLQAALRSLGYPGGDPSGTFGSGTKAAVAALYRGLGYPVPTTGGLADVDAAAQAVTGGQRAIDLGRQRVAQAQVALAAAQTASPPVPSAIERATQALARATADLGDAAEHLANAQRTLRLLVARTGAEMPLSEFVFLPTLPAVLGSVNGRVGSTVSTPLVTIDTGPLVVSAVLGPGDHGLVKTGQDVTVAAEQIDQQARGRLAAIGSYRPATQNPSSLDAPLPAGYPITVTPANALPATWLGLNVRVTITAAATSGRVLVVPVAALSATRDGATSVSVLNPDSTRTAVPVTAGLDANGLVEVLPAAGARLRPGDRVVIG
jgi:HlyD family secretion protein